jgi:hypothetical protein
MCHKWMGKNVLKWGKNKCFWLGAICGAPPTSV